MNEELQIGEVLDERFKILELISRSGMANIYKAVDMTDGSVAAIKVPFMRFESDPAFYSRFQREDEIGCALQHPSIMRVIRVKEKSRLYIAMEYLPGKTLGQILRARGVLPAQEACAIASKVCDALVYMHQEPLNVVHRDLKPDNIMMIDDGSLRIMDFGIARAALRKVTLPGFGSKMGTPNYISPEQVKGQRGDARSDIYALGAMLYEMVTGTAPFAGDSEYDIMNARLVGDPIAPSRVNGAVSPQVEEIILQALARNPADRYANAAAMKSDLDAPESVTITGRAAGLKAPQQWRVRAQAVLPLILALAIPVILLVMFVLIFRK
jgi:serine/threonine protein kinase